MKRSHLNDGCEWNDEEYKPGGNIKKIKSKELKNNNTSHIAQNKVKKKDESNKNLEEKNVINLQLFESIPVLKKNNKYYLSQIDIKKLSNNSYIHPKMHKFRKEFNKKTLELLIEIVIQQKIEFYKDNFLLHPCFNYRYSVFEYKSFINFVKSDPESKFGVLFGNVTGSKPLNHKIIIDLDKGNSENECEDTVTIVVEEGRNDDNNENQLETSKSVKEPLKAVGTDLQEDSNSTKLVYNNNTSKEEVEGNSEEKDLINTENCFKRQVVRRNDKPIEDSESSESEEEESKEVVTINNNINEEEKERTQKGYFSDDDVMIVLSSEENDPTEQQQLITQDDEVKDLNEYEINQSFVDRINEIEKTIILHLNNLQLKGLQKLDAIYNSLQNQFEITITNKKIRDKYTKICVLTYLLLCILLIENTIEHFKTRDRVSILQMTQLQEEKTSFHGNKIIPLKRQIIVALLNYMQEKEIGQLVKKTGRYVIEDFQVLSEFKILFNITIITLCNYVMDCKRASVFSTLYLLMKDKIEKSQRLLIQLKNCSK
ncbi:hypothetical protein ABK040_011707 [Willaertia magna]